MVISQSSKAGYELQKAEQQTHCTREFKSAKKD